MPMITYFKSVIDTSQAYHREVSSAITRIRDGSSKALVERIRVESDKDRRNLLKRQLPAICFSGKFTARSASACVEHSGLICLDFDGFESDLEMAEFRFDLTSDPYSYAVFTSPSGDGLKVIVRIPKDIKNHKNYFLALQKHYNRKEFDVACKDISRVCYESYDPNIYINESSKIWEEVHVETMDIKNSTPTIRLENETEIVKRLRIWWEKEFGMVSGSRNNNLFVLAKALNEFGVPETTARDIMLSYDTAGDMEREIPTIAWSAYKDKAAHGTKFYEDTEKIDAIKQMAKSGTPTEDIIQISKDIDVEVVQKIVKDADEGPSIFWTKNSKGAVKHINHLYKEYLEGLGFAKYYVNGGDIFVFVKVNNNVISDVTTDEIRDTVLNKYLYKLQDKSIFNYFADRTKLFTEDHLSFLRSIEPKVMRDTKDMAYLYFRNCVVRITAGGYETIDYMDIDGYIWEKQKIDRDFIVGDHSQCVYKRFISRIGGADSDKVSSIESTIGYLMHSFKPPHKSPAVILNDEVISDNPNGGSGKSLFMDAIAKIKRTVVIDGKMFSFSKSFPYQRVSADTQMLVFDDAQKSFDFERLFSVITGGITLEKKNKDEIHIPFERSPKIVITTNYGVRGSGGSFDRRKHELEWTAHYNKDFTPYDEFGHFFFSDWDKNEWTRFDNYMVSNIQLYLQKGLMQTGFKNIKLRNLVQSTSFDFVEWAKDPMNDLTKALTEHYAASVYNGFVEANPDYGPRGRFPILQRRFYKWLDLYGEYMYNTSPKRWKPTEGMKILWNVKLPEQLNMFKDATTVPDNSNTAD